MGLVFRTYICEDEKIKKIPAVKFQRLWNGDPEEKIPEYAGKRLKFASIVVELENRKPVNVAHSDYLLIKIDDQGRFDRREMEQMHIDAMKGIDLLGLLSPDENTPANVIDKSTYFQHKKYLNKYQWNPNPKEIGDIYDLIFLE